MNTDKMAIDVNHVTIRFNLANQKVDNLKEYVIKLVKKELMFQEFLALRDVSLRIRPGEAWGIVGTNGSGKSTLSKNLNAILFPTEGNILINKMDTREEDKLWDIRQTAGMVFQNPDNQIVATVVEEDFSYALLTS